MADDTKTIYVGGFSNETNASSLQAAFLPFGEVVDVQLPSDPANKSRHRNFAFVSFSSLTAATDAIDNMHRNELPDPSNKGRSLKVNMARPPKGLKPGMGNRAIWTDEAWIKEHGMASVEEMQQSIGTQGP